MFSEKVTQLHDKARQLRVAYERKIVSRVVVTPLEWLDLFDQYEEWAELIIEETSRDRTFTFGTRMSIHRSTRDFLVEILRLRRYVLLQARVG